jgi:hypothetical protein
MPQTIELEGVGTFEFPDEATDDQISEFLNKQRPEPKPTAFLSQGAPPSILTRIRESAPVTALLGPTESQRLTQGVPNADTGRMEYKPNASVYEREGLLFGAPAAPPSLVFDESPKDGTVAKVAKGISNAAVKGASSLMDPKFLAGGEIAAGAELAGATIPKMITAAVKTGLTGTLGYGAVQGAKTAIQAAKEGDVQEATEAGITALASAAGAGAASGAFKYAAGKIGEAAQNNSPATAKALAETAIDTKETSNAIQEQSAGEMGVRNGPTVGAKVGGRNAEPEAAPEAGNQPESTGERQAEVTQQDIEKAKAQHFVNEEHFKALYESEGLKPDGQYEGETPEEYLMRVFCS